jgi:hypothetical protein
MIKNYSDGGTKIMGCGRQIGDNCKNASCLKEICDNFFYGDIPTVDALPDVDLSEEIICQTDCNTCTNTVCFYDKAELKEQVTEYEGCSAGKNVMSCDGKCSECTK